MRWDGMIHTQLISELHEPTKLKGPSWSLFMASKHQVFWINLVCLCGAFTSSPLLRCSFGLRLAAAAGLGATLFSFDENLTTPPLWHFLLPFERNFWASRVFICTKVTLCTDSMSFHLFNFFFLQKGDKQMDVRSFPSPSGQSSSSRRTLKVRLFICPLRMKKPQSIQTR